MDKLVELPLNQAIDVATTLLQETNAVLPVSTQMLERLRLNLDDEMGMKRILKMLIMYGAPSPILTDQLLELLQISEYPKSIIECTAALAGNNEKNLEKIIMSFQDFIHSAGDGDLWLNIIGALSELELTSERLRIRVFKLITESLDIVEEEDVPIVVRTLLHTVTKSTAQQIVRLVRQQCSSLSLETQYLLLQVIETSMKIESNLPKIFLNSFKINFPNNAFDLCLLLSISQIDTYHQRANNCIFDALTMTTTISSTTSATNKNNVNNNYNNKYLKISDIVSICKRTKEIEWETFSLPMFKFIQFVLIRITEHRNGASLRRRMIQLCQQSLATLLCSSEECRSTIFTNLITITQCSPSFYRKLPDYKGKSDWKIVLDDNSYVSGAMISDMASDVLLTCARKIPRLLRTHVYILEEELFRPRLSEKIVLSTWTIHQLCRTLIYIYNDEEEETNNTPMANYGNSISNSGSGSSNSSSSNSSARLLQSSNSSSSQQQSSYSSRNYSNLLVSVQKLLISGSNRINNSNINKNNKNNISSRYESIYQQQRVGMIMAMHLLKSNCLTTISCKDIINWVLRLLGLIVNRYNYMDKTGSNRSAASNNDKFDNKNDIENEYLNDIFSYGMDLLKENLRFIPGKLCNEIIYKVIIKQMESEQSILKSNDDDTEGSIMRQRSKIRSNNTNSNGKESYLNNVLNGVKGKTNKSLYNKCSPMPEFALNCIVDLNVDINNKSTSNIMSFNAYLNLHSEMIISKRKHQFNENNDDNENALTLSPRDISSLLSATCVNFALPAWECVNNNKKSNTVGNKRTVVNGDNIKQMKKKRRISLQSIDTNGNVNNNFSSGAGIQQTDSNTAYYDNNSVWYYEDFHNDVNVLRTNIANLSSNYDKINYAHSCFQALLFQCAICNFIGEEVDGKPNLMDTNPNLMKDYKVIMFQSYRRFIWLRIKLDLLLLNLNETRSVNAFANDFKLVQKLLVLEQKVKTEMPSPSFYVVLHAYQNASMPMSNENISDDDDDMDSDGSNTIYSCFQCEILSDLYHWMHKVFSSDYNISGRLDEFTSMKMLNPIEIQKALKMFLSTKCIEVLGKHCMETIHYGRLLRRTNTLNNDGNGLGDMNKLQTIVMSQLRIYTAIELLLKQYHANRHTVDVTNSLYFKLFEELIAGFTYNAKNVTNDKTVTSIYMLKDLCFTQLKMHLELVEDSTVASKIVDILSLLTANVAKAVCIPPIVYKTVVQNIFPLQSNINHLHIGNLQHQHNNSSNTNVHGNGCNNHGSNGSSSSSSSSVSNHSKNYIHAPWIVLDEYEMAYSGMLKMRQKTLIKESNPKLMLVDLLKSGGNAAGMAPTFPAQLVYVIHGLVTSSFINMRTNSMIYMINDLVESFKIITMRIDIDGNSNNNNNNNNNATEEMETSTNTTTTTTTSRSATTTTTTTTNMTNTAKDIQAISKDNYEIFYELFLKFCNCSLAAVNATSNTAGSNNIVTPYDDFFIATKQICEMLEMFSKFEINDERNYTYILIACMHSIRLSWKKFDDAIAWRTTNRQNDNKTNSKDWWNNKKLNVAIIGANNL